MSYSAPSTRSTGDIITAAIWNQDVVANVIALTPTGLIWLFDGGGAPYSTGIHRPLLVPFTHTISRATLLHDQSSTTTIDIWKTTYANYDMSTHPVNGDSITASAEPNTSAAIKSQDTTLSGWTTSGAADAIYLPNVDANDNAAWTMLSLKIAYS